MKKSKKIFIGILAGIVLISTSIVSVISINATELTEEEELIAELKEMVERSDELDRLDAENELMSLKIMREHGKTDATEPISDGNEYISLMREMCVMIKNREFTDEETIILMRYLYRNVGLINIPNERPLFEGEAEVEQMILELIHDESLPNYKDGWHWYR